MRQPYDRPNWNALELLVASDVPNAATGQVIWHHRARHDTALVVVPAGQSWFVKHCGAPLGSRPVSLQGEATFYQAVAAGRFPTAIAAVVPQLVSRCSDDTYLVLEGLPAHTDLRTQLLTTNGTGEMELTWLGRVLGSLHSIRDPRTLTSFSRADNPTITFGRCTPEALAHNPPAFGELLRSVQRYPEVNERLRELRTSWCSTTLTHGDVKLDNVLVPREGSDQGATQRPLLIDWELVGLGDSRWDCAGAIGSYLLTRIERWSQDIRGGAVWDDVTVVPGALRAFSAAYAEVRSMEAGFDGDHAGNEALVWAGYWLLHRLMLMLPGRQHLGPTELMVLHLATQLLAGSMGDPAVVDHVSVELAQTGREVTDAQV